MGRVVGEGAQGRCAGLRADRHPRGVVGVLQRPGRVIFGQPFRRLSEGGELAARVHPELPGFRAPGEQRGLRGVHADHERARCAMRRPPGRPASWRAGLPGRPERRSGRPRHTRNPPRFRAAPARRRWPEWRWWRPKRCWRGGGNRENGHLSIKFSAGPRGRIGARRNPNNPAASVLKVPVPTTWAGVPARRRGVRRRSPGGSS